MKTGQGLVEYAIAQLGRPYWWGCFGQRADAALYARKKKQYPAYYTATDFSSQYGQKVHDCVGLIKGYLWCDTPDGSPKYNAAQDVAVEGLYRKCSRRGDISTLPETPGVCVFMANMDHVGVYIGNGEVVEAMGHAYGVVKTKLKGRGWSYWGMPGWLDYGNALDNTGAVQTPSSPTSGTFTPKRMRYLRKGDTGEDIKSMQSLLKFKGFDIGPAGADGKFGTKTKTGLEAFQKACGITADGEFGPDTMAELWGYHG